MMRILSVPTKSLLHVPFLNLKVISVSLRQILYIVVCVVLLAQALHGEDNVLLAVPAMLFAALAFVPFKFITPEMHLIHALAFRFAKPEHHSRDKTNSSEMLFAGRQSSQIQEEQQETVQRFTISDLGMPHTISLDTTEKRQFVPVGIEIDGKVLVNTATERHGKVCCTIMIESLGPKKIRVIRAEDDSVLYDRRVIFEG